MPNKTSVNVINRAFFGVRLNGFAAGSKESARGGEGRRGAVRREAGFGRRMELSISQCVMQSFLGDFTQVKSCNSLSFSHFHSTPTSQPRRAAPRKKSVLVLQRQKTRSDGATSSKICINLRGAR